MENQSKLISHYENCAYLKGYYGMSRDIFVFTDHIEVLFKIILNDHISFSFKCLDAPDESTLNRLEKYIQDSTYLDAGLPYNSKAAMNSAIRVFIHDVLSEALPLPDKSFKFMGDRARLEHYLEDKDCAFIWDDDYEI